MIQVGNHIKRSRLPRGYARAPSMPVPLCNRLCNCKVHDDALVARASSVSAIAGESRCCINKDRWHIGTDDSTMVHAYERSLRNKCTKRKQEERNAARLSRGAFRAASFALR